MNFVDCKSFLESNSCDILALCETHLDDSIDSGNFSVRGYIPLTLFRMGIFGAAHEWGGGKKAPLPKICHVYPTMMKLGTVIPYLKKIQEKYESRDTRSDFC